jgi:preprotein translocase subunit SecA
MKGLLRKIDEAAGGLSEYEEELVKAALDERLALHGLDPVFGESEEDEKPEHVHGPDCAHDHETVAPAPIVTAKVGRNDPCPCGSGKKYKKCHGA